MIRLLSLLLLFHCSCVSTRAMENNHMQPIRPTAQHSGMNKLYE